MIIKKLTRILFFSFLFLAATNTLQAQEKTSNTEDAQLKETLYKKFKKEVQSYDKKEFDALFFEFFKKTKDKTLTLTKEEFYTYTIKIAAYSEKLGLLYKDQKETADRTKQEWFDKSYTDYLNSKK
ncbi:hypothetical protein [Flavobacterium wongokense]|uniref:hypothetical protein n=1 Tax=Flavobacterium wongokense TaxID=2910674 RepID=UPI001F4802DF|nr:hypothetical protein [Flavobacterium sp. WG47]MCF6131125.1 hypothetical protein [Flavobacterium sp. WG47]